MSVALNTWSQQPKLVCVKSITIFKILSPKATCPKEDGSRTASQEGGKSLHIINTN